MSQMYPYLHITLLVTTGVGLITYLVVMNLRTLVSLIKAGLSIPREYILKKIEELEGVPGSEHSPP
jgi:hypothetical protein